MAKVLLAPILSDLSGKLANAVFTKGRSVLAVRTRVAPRNPKTTGQTTIRGYLKSWSAAWRAQAEADIAAWNTYAAGHSKSNKFGGKYSMTGHKLFVERNIINSEFGNGVVITTPVDLTPPASIGISTFEAVASTHLAHVTSADPVGANTILAVYASKQSSAGRSNFKGTFRHIKNFPAGTAAGVLEFGTEYEAKFGTLTTGLKFAVIFKQTDVHATVKSALYPANGELAGKVKAS